MRLILIVMTTAIFASPAQAQSRGDKLCIFAATQKLPNMPGLTIVASRAKAGPAAPEAARILAQHFSDLKGAEELAYKFGLLNAAQFRDVQSSLAQGSPQRAASTITTAITGAIKDSLTVEIDIRAAAQSATFSFLCVSSGESPLIAALGMAP